MGGNVSLPLKVEELDDPFVSNINITPLEFFNHHTEQAQNSGTKLNFVPPELTSKVSLYQTVDLSFNHIYDIPETLPLTLPHLTCLNLNHNRLTVLPNSIFGFVHLQELDVSHNQLTSLPETFINLNNLKKLDLSYNNISCLPTNISLLSSLEKVDLSSNKLTHLPIELGNIHNLRVLLSDKNELGELCDWSSQKLIRHLVNCYQESQKGDVRIQGNQFRRERGAVFDSKILNAGSAQSFFNQIQTQAVNTGNRILTPLIPPPNATTLDSETIKDCVLGMFYGAVLGDCLGVYTQSLSKTQAEFYYERDSLLEHRLHVDEFRCHFNKGEVTLASKIVFDVLDSVMQWGGVVDELDYAQKLQQLLKNTDKPLTSPVLQGVSAKANFGSDPQAAAKEWFDLADSAIKKKKKRRSVVCDSFCLPPMIGLVVSQFHDLDEIERNAARICASTHADKENIVASGLVAKLLARLLQGVNLTDAIADIEDHLETLQDMDENETITLSHPFTTLQLLKECIEVYVKLGFEPAILRIIFKGNEACVGGQLVGSVLGLVVGFSNLPSQFINAIDESFRRVMEKKLNTLLDMMGIP